MPSAPKAPVATEEQVEKAITAYLAIKGWQTIKTDASLVKRGTGRPGVIPMGTPDNISFKARGWGSGPALGTLDAFVWECKRPGGKLRKSQEQRLAYLAGYGISVHVWSDLQQAIDHLNQLGRQ